MYIRNSTPRPEPVKFSPAAKTGIRRAHNASVKTVNVTKTTVGMINGVSKSEVSSATHAHLLEPGYIESDRENI